MISLQHIKSIAVDQINVNEGPRPIDDLTVAALAKSMAEIGMMTPITITLSESGANGESCYDIVAGRHRLAAAKQLGWTEIDALRLDCFNSMPEDADAYDIVAEMWSIAENLYRAPLTKEQRDQHIRRYAELLVKKEQAEAKAGDEAKSDNLTDFNQVGAGRGNKGTATKIADQLGLSQRTVRRALIPPKPKSECRPPESKASLTERQVQALLVAWDAAGPQARSEFLRMVQKPTDFSANAYAQASGREAA
jgi:ParB family chromosome partitioning protein